MCENPVAPDRSVRVTKSLIESNRKNTPASNARDRFDAEVQRTCRKSSAAAMIYRICLTNAQMHRTAASERAAGNTISYDAKLCKT